MYCNFSFVIELKGNKQLCVNSGCRPHQFTWKLTLIKCAHRIITLKMAGHRLAIHKANICHINSITQTSLFQISTLSRKIHENSIWSTCSFSSYGQVWSFFCGFDIDLFMCVLGISIQSAVCIVFPGACGPSGLHQESWPLLVRLLTWISKISFQNVPRVCPNQLFINLSSTWK